MSFLAELQDALCLTRLHPDTVERLLSQAARLEAQNEAHQRECDRLRGSLVKARAELKRERERRQLAQEMLRAAAEPLDEVNGVEAPMFSHGRDNRSAMP